VGWEALEEAYTVKTTKIVPNSNTSQLTVSGKVFSLHRSYVRLFPFYPQVRGVDETHDFVPVTAACQR
jgi:hypothetical protein